MLYFMRKCNWVLLPNLYLDMSGDSSVRGNIYMCVCAAKVIAENYEIK